MKRELKILTTVTMACLMVLMTAGLTGCNKEQVKAVAQNAGLFSAVGWIAKDNPTSNEVAAVESILVVIEENAADVQAGATYTEVLLPEVVKIIDADVEAQYRPLCKAGAGSILGALDLLFASKPEWKEDEKMAIDVVSAFVLGAKTGLSMSEKDPVMVEARAAAQRRIVVEREIVEFRALQAE